MLSPKIKAVIFDLGNVLLDFDHFIAARKIAKFTDLSAEDIYNLFFDSELTGLFEEGKIPPEEFFLKIKEALNLKLNFEAFLPIWNEIFFFSERNIALYTMVKLLKKNYNLALLSNINILHFEYIKKNFPVFGAFENIVTSFEVGFRKPHPLIYKKTLELLNVLPENVFYTDDRIELVSKANELGIKGSVFINPEKLQEDFLSAGISME